MVANAALLHGDKIIVGNIHVAVVALAACCFRLVFDFVRTSSAAFSPSFLTLERDIFPQTPLSRPIFSHPIARKQVMLSYVWSETGFTPFSQSTR